MIEEQLTIDSYLNELPPQAIQKHIEIDPLVEATRTSEKIGTSRQWRLYEFIMERSKRGLKTSLKQMLNHLDELYGYSQEQTDHPYREWVDLKSRRDLSDDINANLWNPDIHYVYIGGKYATTDEEADEYLAKEESRLKNLWKRHHLQKMKRSLDGQTRLVFNSGKDIWLSIIRAAEEEIKKIEEQGEDGIQEVEFDA